MSFGTILEVFVLEAVFENVAFPTMGHIYVALWDGDPGEIGTGGSEVPDTVEGNPSGYVRVDTVGLWARLLGETPSVVKNDTEIVFPEALEDWGTVTHFAICMYESLPGLLAYGSLWSPKEVAKGSIPRFGVGSLEVSLD